MSDYFYIIYVRNHRQVIPALCFISWVLWVFFFYWYIIRKIFLSKTPLCHNLREDADMTQQQMADILFINRRTYSSYELGIRGIPIEILGKIADHFNTSIDYLVERTDSKKPYPRKKK